MNQSSVISHQSSEFAVSGKPLDERCATVTMPVKILQAIYHMQMLANGGRSEVLVRLSDWKVVEQKPLDNP